MKKKKMLLLKKVAPQNAVTQQILNAIQRGSMSGVHSVSKNREDRIETIVKTAPKADTLSGDREHPIVLDDTNDESPPVSPNKPPQNGKKSNQAPLPHLQSVRNKPKTVTFQLPEGEPLHANRRITDSKVQTSPWFMVSGQIETKSLEVPDKKEAMAIFCDKQKACRPLQINKSIANSTTTCSRSPNSSPNQVAVPVTKITSARWADLHESISVTVQIPDPPSRKDASSLFRYNRPSNEPTSSSSHPDTSQRHMELQDRSRIHSLDSAAKSSLTNNCRSTKELPNQEAFQDAKIKSICWADLSESGSATVQFSVPPSKDDARNLFCSKHRNNGPSYSSIDNLPENRRKIQESIVESSPWFDVSRNESETSRCQEPPTKVDASVIFLQQSKTNHINTSEESAKPNSSVNRVPCLPSSKPTENDNVTVHRVGAQCSEYHPKDRCIGRGKESTESSRTSSDTRTRSDFGSPRKDKSVYGSQKSEREKAYRGDSRHRSRSSSSHRDSESDRLYDRKDAYSYSSYYHAHRTGSYGHYYDDHPPRDYYSAYDPEVSRYTALSYSSKRDYSYHESGHYDHVSTRSHRTETAERRLSPVHITTSSTTAGRGRKMTEPAWMTCQKQNKIHNETMVEVDKENPVARHNSPLSFAELANQSPPKPRSLLP
jgi:hypothetical protein